MPFLARSAVLGSFLGAVAVATVTAKDALPSRGGGPGSPGDASAESGPRAVSNVEPRGAVVCGGFSAEGRYENLPVAWSFRLCESAVDAYEIQLRFRNLAHRPVQFGYRVWLREPGDCRGSSAGGGPVLKGSRRLQPGHTDEWPYTAGGVLRVRYGGRIWSCVIAE